MKVMVACEYSGIVRSAFADLGHDAWSCDLLPSELPGQHLEADILDVDLSTYDLLIAHPPCTYLAISGARWFGGRVRQQDFAVRFVEHLLNVDVPSIAVENPIGVLSTRIRKPDQIIQPFQFGIGERKGTCLWLKNLPLLRPTRYVNGRHPAIHRMGPSAQRGHNRSRTYPGIARAMAEQWGE